MSKAAAWSVPSSWAIAVAMAGVCSMWVTVATMTQSICAGVDAGALERLARRRDRHHLHGLLGRGPAALLDARALLDPLVAGVDRVDDLGVGDHPRRAVGADARGCAACGAPVAVLIVAISGSLRVEADQGLAGGDQVAVLDQPLDDLAAVRRRRRRSCRGCWRRRRSRRRARGRRRRRPARSGGRCP